MILISSLQILCFVPVDLIEGLFDEIAKHYSKEKIYSEFLTYYRGTWLKKFPSYFWNYADLFENFHGNKMLDITNNYAESLNNQIAIKNDRVK